MNSRRGFGIELLLVTVILLGGILTSCSTTNGDAQRKKQPAAALQEYSFKLINQVFPAGQDTTHIVIDLGTDIFNTSSTASVDTFSVSTTNVLPRTITGGSDIVYDGPRKITGIRVSRSGEWDETLNTWPAALTDQEVAAGSLGRYIWLELEYGQIPPGANPVPGAGTLAYVELTGTPPMDGPTAWNYLLDLQYKVKQERQLLLPNGKMLTGIYKKSTERGDNEVVAGEINPLVNKFEAGRYTGTDPGNYLEYQLYRPSGAAPNGGFPLVVWLHGSGERRTPFGVQNQNHLRANEEGVAWVKPENLRDFGPYWVLVPQSVTDGWTDEALINVKAVIDSLTAAKNNINLNRIYVLGDSMGGRGMWDIITANPNLFAAAVGAPAATDISDVQVELLKNVPIWLLNIDTDSQEGSLASYNKMKAAGGNIRWTHYNAVTDLPLNNYSQPHWVWIPTLQNVPKVGDAFYKAPPAGITDTVGHSLWQWLFAQRKTNP
ncbi:MAG: hypothetical protein LBD78_06160 [Spirochaetaceae bacterium]|jgi:predicted peptidase|nr:hypothetical protein [Spirochaetaceae bacterium]